MIGIEQWQAARDIHLDHHMLGARLRARDGGAVAHEIRRVDDVLRELDPARLDLRDGDKVVDEVEQALPGIVDVGSLLSG